MRYDLVQLVNGRWVNLGDVETGNPRRWLREWVDGVGVQGEETKELAEKGRARLVSIDDNDKAYADTDDLPPMTTWTRANPPKALDKKALARSIEKDRRDTLKRLRAKVAGARSSKREAFAAIGAQCRAGRDRVAEARARVREAKARASVAREEARASCEIPAGVAALKDAVAVAVAELRAEEGHLRTLREADRMARARTSKRPLAKARERRSESDDEVRANIPGELVSLFNRVRRSIKGSPRKSRTEEFLEYVEAHPDEAFAGIDDETDRMIAAHEAELRAHAGGGGRRRRANPRPSPALRDKALREYVKKHWGELGDFDTTQAVVVDPTHGALVILGRLEAVTYSTRKGEEDRGVLTNYEHKFGGTRPWLAFHVCDDKRCPVRGKLVIAGGTYRTQDRGIVG